MLSLKQINNQSVKAIPIPDEDKRPIKGYDLCEEVYANIFLCARKKSGKTSALFKIMKECSVKQLLLFFVVHAIKIIIGYKYVNILKRKKWIFVSTQVYMKMVKINYLI